MDIMHLLQNNPLEEGPSKGARRNGGLDSKRIWQQMLTYKSNYIRTDQQKLGITIRGGRVSLNKIKYNIWNEYINKKKNGNYLPKKVSFAALALPSFNCHTNKS